MRTVVYTIEYSIVILIARVDLAATTNSGLDFAGIIWTQIVTVEGSIAVRVHIAHPAAAYTWICLGWVIRTEITTIRSSIPVRVHITHPTTAHTWIGLGWVIWTVVNTISHSIMITICVSYSASALTWIRFVRIVRTPVAVAVRNTVMVQVRIRNSASTDPRIDLAGVFRTAITDISIPICVRVTLTWIGNNRTVVTHISVAVIVPIMLIGIGYGWAVVADIAMAVPIRIGLV